MSELYQTAQGESHEHEAASGSAGAPSYADDANVVTAAVPAPLGTKLYPKKNTVLFVMDILRLAYTTMKLEPKYYIKGGYLRDNLLRVPHVDVDMTMHVKVYPKFVELLRMTDRLRAEHIMRTVFNSRGLPLHDTLDHESCYASYKLEIVNSYDKLELLDITLAGIYHQKQRSASGRYINTCDFTCNNLIMDASGNVCARVARPGIHQETNEHAGAWTMQCIADTVAKRLVWMLPHDVCDQGTLYEQISSVTHYHKRLKKMLDKGFVMGTQDDRDDCHCRIAPSTSADRPRAFILPRLKSLKDVNNETEYTGQSHEACLICHDAYDAEVEARATCWEPYTILLECNHCFHYECMMEYLKKPSVENHKCPLCRQDVRIAKLASPRL